MVNDTNILDKIDVLDKGYVILKDYMGDDLKTVNSARVSYEKESFQLTDDDVRLIKYLGRELHTSPFRHSIIQFEVYAPLMIARQWWKYVVGSDHRDPFTAWNESSRRYVTEEPRFYVVEADEWRSKPKKKKQGSGEPLDAVHGTEWTLNLIKHYNKSIDLYEEAMKAGICAEQARLFLPAYALYVRWYWTASLQSVAHLINQRSKPDAQKEFQLYAKAVYDLTKKYFPLSLDEYLQKGV